MSGVRLQVAERRLAGRRERSFLVRMSGTMVRCRVVYLVCRALRCNTRVRANKSDYPFTISLVRNTAAPLSSSSAAA